MRAGTIKYESVSGNTVSFMIQMQWRRDAVFAGSGLDGRAVTGDAVDVMGAVGSAVGPVAFETGDGRSYPVRMVVTQHSEAEQWLHGTARVMHTYVTTNNAGAPWRATLKGCCRAGGGGAFRLTAALDLATAHASPVFRSLPVITVGQTPPGVTSQVRLPADTLHGQPAEYWRLAQGDELGDLTTSGAAFFEDDNYRRGLLTVDTGALPEGTLQIAVQAAARGAMVPLEFQLRVVTSGEWAHRPAVVTPVGYFPGAPPMSPGAPDNMAPPPPMPLPGTLSIAVGYELFFTLEASSPPDSGRHPVALRAFELPQGASLSNVREDVSTGRRTVDVRWVPAERHRGQQALCVHAVDGMGLASEQMCVELVVPPEPAPPPRITTPLPGATFSFYMRNSQSFDVVAESINPHERMQLSVTEPLELGQTFAEHGMVQGRVRATDVAPSAVARGVFKWWPGVDAGAYNRTVCFHLAPLDTGAIPGGVAARSSTTCVRVIVERCKYVVQPGDDIRTVARTFGVDWLTLWGINVGLASLAPPAGTEIMVGRLYTVLEGDTLLSMADEFETTVGSIRRCVHAPLKSAATRPGSSMPVRCPVHKPANLPRLSAVSTSTCRAHVRPWPSRPRRSTASSPTRAPAVHRDRGRAVGRGTGSRDVRSRAARVLRGWPFCRL